MSHSDYIPRRWLLQQQQNKQGKFAAEAKETRKPGQVTLQKEGTKIMDSQHSPFIHLSFHQIFIVHSATGVLSVDDTLWSEFLITREDRILKTNLAHFTVSTLKPASLNFNSPWGGIIPIFHAQVLQDSKTGLPRNRQHSDHLNTAPLSSHLPV